MTLPGLMQDAPLLISGIIRYAARAHGQREIVSRFAASDAMWRYGYAACEERARRVAQTLTRLGIEPGDRVSSLAWNTHQHFELFYAVPGVGAVLHTANPRLSAEQIAYTINHADSKILLYDSSLAELVARIVPLLVSVRMLIAIGHDCDPPNKRLPVLGYEALVESDTTVAAWPTFDENSAAFLCYTSGTTGEPKGALYSHRSVVLHAMASCAASAFGFTPFDVVMPCSSLYHATAWGVPFGAPLAGARLVLPADQFDGASLHALIQEEGVKFSGGVPTIWTMYLAHLRDAGATPRALRTLVIGGSAVPRSMAEEFETRHGVKVRQLWGMTETSPIGVVSTPTPALAAQGEETLREVIWTRQGRLQFGVELKVIDDDGRALADGCGVPGRLLVRGPWTIRRYYRADADAVDAEGWFDTGDVATIDALGFMRIHDRAKDVIKSGGEWISSIDLENCAAGFPGVRSAAVVGVHHPKWEERPILVVEPAAGCAVDPAALLEFLRPNFVRWWLPDRVIVADVPTGATGKVDKKALRERYGSVLAADTRD